MRNKLILTSVKFRILENNSLVKLKIFSLLPQTVWLTRKIFALTNLRYKDCNAFTLFININQLDALNFITSLFQASTYFEHMCSKRVEVWNKLVIKFIVSSCLILINKCEMHGQQNIKKKAFTLFIRATLKGIQNFLLNN